LCVFPYRPAFILSNRVNIQRRQSSWEAAALNVIETTDTKAGEDLVDVHAALVKEIG
jgi:hypothetical protein